MSRKVLFNLPQSHNHRVSKLKVIVSAVLFFIAITQLQAQNCAVNANINQSVCANETLTLVGSKAGLFYGDGTTTWSQVAGPSAIIVSPNSLISEVTGVVGGYSYTFRLSTTCLDGSLVYDDVTYIVLSITDATAGPDQSSCPASPAGTLAGNTPGANSSGLWTVVGNNNGVTILNPTSPTSDFNLAAGQGQTTLRWTITHVNGCISFDDMVVTNIGGELPVNAGPDQVLGNCYSSTQSTTLTASFGGDGTAGQSGVWTVVSGPGIPDIANPTSRITGVSGLSEGVYVFRWTVSGPCVNGSDEVQVTVPAPTSDVTSAIIIGGSQIWCDGRTSTVLIGTPPYYTNETVLWQQTNGPGGVTIESPTNPVTNITGLDGSSTYTFRYTIVNNVTACSSSETATVSFATAPFISIVPEQLFASCGTGSVSIPFTAGGSGVTQWSIVSGPSTPAYPTLPTGYFTAGSSPLVITNLSVPGTYLVSMRRYSNIGITCETAFDAVYVVVSQPPTQSNAGTRQVLACNVFQTELTGNIPLVGTGMWSQVSGPGIATIADLYSPTTMVSDLLNGLYRFRWIISGGPTCPANQHTTTVLVASVIPTQANAGPDQNVCIGTPIFLSANYPVLNEWGEWSVTPDTPGLTFSNINSPVAMVTGQEANTIYTFTWTIYNACGTTSDDCLINTNNTVGPIISEAGEDQCHLAGTTSIALEGNDPAPGIGFWNQLTGPAAVITDPTLYNSAVTGLADGNYTFEWVINSGGCLPTRDTVMVTISEPVTPADAGTDIELCGTSTTLTGNTPVIGTGFWTQEGGAGGAVIANPASPTTGVSGLTDGVYTFYWTISNYACSPSVDSVFVYVASPGSVAVAGPDQDLCAQSSTTMAATPPAIGSGVWTIVTGPNTPNIVNPTSPTTVINNLITGTYTFRWTVSGGTFCPTTSDEVNVIVNLAANAGPDQSYCEATTAVNLTGTVSTAGTWTQDSGPNTAIITTTSANTAVASGLIPGVYVFRFTISTPGCESFDVMTVTLYPPASTAVAGPDQDLCDAAGFALDGNTPAFGTGVWTKLAGPGSGTFIPDANTPNAIYTGALPGVYVFVWTISNGNCSNGDQVRIENSASPTIADAGPDQTQVCSVQATMAANLPLIGVGNWTQVSGPNTANIQSVILPNTVIDGMIPGTYTFLWTITNGGVCLPSSDEVEITALLTPTPADAGPDQSLCNQLSTTMAATPVVIGTGAWSQVSGPNSASFLDASNPLTGVDNLINGTYIFEWTTTEGFCTSVDQVTVQNYALPTIADAGTDQDICLFSPLTLSGNTPIVGTGEWTQTSGPISVNILSPNSPVTSVIGALSGTYTFEWTISNGTCLPSTDEVTVIINDIPDQALAGPDQSLCNTDNTFLNGNNPTLGTGTWSQLSGPNSATIINPLDRQTQVTNLIAGTYEFEWEIANGSCTSADIMLVVRHADISVTGPSDATICNGGTQILTVSASGGIGGYTYQWESSADGNIPWNTISGATSASYTTPALSADQYYRCLVTASCGFTYSAAAHVTIVPDPAITLQPTSITICSGTTTVLSVTATGGTPALNYQWQSSPNGTSGWVNVGSNSPSYTTAALAQTTYYRVTVSASGNGCNSITSNVVTVSVPRITTQPISSTICTGGSVNALTIVVDAGSSTLAYQWQSATALAGPYSDVSGGSGANTPSYITDVLTLTTYFRCVVTVTSPDCADLISNVATITVVPDPTINTNPVGTTICVGGTHTLTVAASGGTPSRNYQWQSSTTGGAPWTNVGTNSSSYTTAALAVTTYYQVLVSATGNDCNTATSTVAEVTVVPDPTISVQPVGATICDGGTHNMSVTATGNVSPGTLNYQWQISTTFAGTYTNVGANSDTYTTTALAATRYYRVIITQPASGCSTTSSVATVTVVADPAITTQPVGASICYGGDHTMTVVATGGTPSRDYQWQISTTGAGGPWSDLTGETGTSYTTAALIATTWYRVVVSATGAGCATVTSNVAAVVVEGDPQIDVQPVGAEICEGGTHSMSISASGGTPTLEYQWESSTVGSGGPWTPIAGANTDAYTTPALLVTTWYHVVVTAPGSDCNTTITNVAEVTVVPDPAISVQPADITICSGTTTTLTVTAINGTPSLNYLWETSANGTSGWATVGGNSNSYTTASLTQTTYYRVSVSATGNGCNSITSNVVTVSVPRILTQPVGAEICSGGSHNMSVLVESGSATIGYQWQFSDFDCNSGWSPIGGANTNTYTASILPPVGTRFYRCVITVSSPDCAALVTNCAAVVVVADPAITLQPLGATICQGSTHTMTVTATGGTPSLNYQWQSASALAGPYSNVTGGSGANTATYTTAAIATTTYYQVIVSATGSGCGTITSTPVSVVVNATPTSYAGVNAAICSNDTYTLSGATASGYTSLLWSTSGTGTFNNQTALNPIYTPSPSDISSGSVILTLTAFANAPCVNAVSSMTLTISAQPTAYAGIDATVCQGTSYTVSTATATNYASLLWTAPGPGALTNATTLTPTYTPTAGQTGTVTLTLTANPNGTCIAAVDQMLITIHAAPTTAIAGIDQSFCKSTTSTNMTANTPTVGIGSWLQLSGPNSAFIANISDPGTLVSNLVTGAYIFQWTITNGVCPSSSDQVQINVLNCAPIAVDDTYTTPEDTPLTGNILANDSDPDGDPIFVTQFIVGVTAYPAGSTVSMSGIGTIIIYSNGLFTFTPELNFTGPVPTIPYTISDGTSTATANLDISVTAVNDPPLAIDDIATTPENIPLNGNVLTNDSDPDGDPITVTQFVIAGDVTVYNPGVQATIPGVGTLIINSDGTFTFTPDAGYNGPVPVVTYTISDGSLSDTATLSIFVDPVNDLPVAQDDNVTTPEDTPVSGNLLTNDSDPDGDLLIVTQFVVGGTTYPAGATVNIPGVGVITIYSNGLFEFNPAPDYNGVVPAIPYTISDGNGGTATANLNITVTGVNDPPIAVNDVNTTPEDTPVSGNVLTNDSDPEGDLLAVTQFVIAGDATVYNPGDVATIPGIGTIVINTNGTYTFTPAPDYNGTVPTNTYTITDGNGGTASANLNITVTPVNDPPVAVEDFFTTNEDIPVSGSVAGNDYDPDGNLNPSSYSVITWPTNGILVLNPNGTFIYTPNLNFNGTDSFVYEVCDLGLPVYCDQATVTITINGVNDPPLAINDHATTPEDTPVSGNVLTNDSDPDGDTIEVTQFVIAGDLTVYSPGDLATIAGVGTIIIYTDGTYTFTPDADYNGNVPTITYTITDGNGGIDTADLNITVTPVNDPPVAEDDFFTTNEDTPVSGTVVGNDYDVDGNLNPNGFALVSGPANGTVSFSNNGTFTYTPNPNYSGTDTFVYSVCDLGMPIYCDQATVTITIDPVNDNPVAVNDVNTTPEDTPVSGNVLTNDSDPEGDPLTVTQFVVSGDPTVNNPGDLATIPGVGTIVIYTDGTYTFTPAPDYNGTVPTITYSITDDNGGAASANLDITVTPVNDPPVAEDDFFTTNEDTPVSGTVVGNDYDVDGNLNPNGFALVSGPANGTVTFSNNGTFTYTPNLNYSGSDTFVYSVCDLGMPIYCDQATVTITIDPVNDLPVAVDDYATTPEDTPVSGNVLTNDSDPESDPLTVTQFVINGDVTVYLPGDEATIAGVGTIVINTDGTYTFTPAPDYNGTVPTITYTITDGNEGSTASANLNITVTPVNDPPVAEDDSFTTDEDTPFTDTVIANDYDVDGNLNPSSYSVITGPADGILSMNPNGTFTYTPNPNFHGIDTFVYEVCDLGLPVYCDQATVTITVNSLNDLPIAVNDIVTTPENTPVSGNVLTNDSDPDGDPLTVTQFVIAGDPTVYNPGGLATIPGVGTLVINLDGSFTFTPEPGYNGAVPVVDYTITDGADFATATLSIFVDPVNDAPLAFDDIYSTPEDTPFNANILINDSDPDGDALTVVNFVVGGLTYPAGASVNIPATGIITIYSNGLLVFAPADGFNGAVPTIPYTITDGNGGTASADIFITVIPVNDPPVAYDDYYTTPEDTPVSGNVLTNDTDPEGDLLTVVDFTINGTTYPAETLATIPGVGTIEVNSDGTFTFTPATDYNGQVPPVDYTISDGNGGTDTGTIYITITPVNDPPVAEHDFFTTNEDIPVSGTVVGNDYDVDGNLNPNGFALVSGPANGTVLFSNNGTFTYTPAPGYSGTDSFVYSVCDLGMPIYCDQATVTITIDPVNDLPVAVDDYATTPEDTPLSGNVLTNDSDPEGDPLTVTQFVVAGDPTVYIPGDLAIIPGVGTIVINTDGTYTFTPAPDYNGTVPTITYTITDGNEGSTASASLFITVTPVNDPPVAVVDYFATTEDTPVSGTVITNDYDVDGNLNPVSHVLVTGVSNGTLTFNALGSFIYTPNPDYYGTDSFIYSVCDLGIPVYCDTAIVFITVTGINDPPVVFNESIEVCTGNSVSGNILANGDYDPEGTELTVNTIPVSGPSNGIFEILSDGSFTYTPNIGYTGTDEVVISLCDNGIPLPPACTNDIISINVLPEAIANAGADQNLCNQTFTFLNGNVAGTATVEWTQISGPPCIIALANTPNAIAFGLIPGTYVFRYSVDNGSCSDFDEVTVVNWASPTVANAGPDQSLCNEISTTLGANMPTIGSGSWSQQSGPSAALFSDLNDPVATVSNLVAGSYILRWTITNGPVCTPSFDDVVISVSNGATAFAGADADICEGSTYTLSGASATNFTSLLWTTSGSGSFSNTGALNPVYTPSAADILNGSVTLTLTAISATPCPNATDAMVLGIEKQAIVYAGVDATICESGSYTLSTATATNVAGLLWTSTGTGTFDDDMILNATYTPSAADIAIGSVTLTLTASPGEFCLPASDAMVLTISLQATADAGVDATICEGSTYTLSTASATNAALVSWSSNGTGSFNNVNLVNATYTPSPADILNGSVILTMTVTSASPCVGATDQMLLSIEKQAIVNAGVDATICETGTYTLSTSSASNASSLLWISSGTGIFDDATLLHATYTPSPADITAGSVTLTLTAPSGEYCLAASDAMVLTISLQATANAGVDATICEGSTYTLSTAVATNAALVTWSSNGTGSFNNVNLVNATYTPSPADILNGSVILTMTVTSASPCVGATDQMVLGIEKQAIVNAGVDATICETATYTLSTATASNATSLLWTSSGTGSFSDATIINPVYTPGATDIAAGSVTLTLTAQSAAPCAPASDAMVLTISLQATADAGVDATICEGSTYTMSTASATNAGIVTWSSNGTGSFDNVNLVNATYTPSNADILNGSVILTMTVMGIAPCANASDFMVLSISKQAIVFAGFDASICEGQTFVPTSATATHAASLLWTSSGTGTFNDPTILYPVYTPSAADIVAGSVTLTLTAPSSLPCPIATDNMVLIISPQALAYAGVDATICEGSTYLISDAVATNAANILWTTTGTGTFNNPTIANPIYTPSPNDILDGFVTLTMIVNSDPPCGGDFDEMMLTISRQAIVYAGPDASVCGAGSFTLTGAMQQFAISLLWTSSGTGTFDDATLINPVYTPSLADVAAGSVTLTLTAQSAAPCGIDVDAMVLIISQQATAYAGADNTICEGSTYLIADATATNASSVLWTTSGTGIFNNPTLVNPTYIPSPNDILDGYVILTMFVNSASPCVGTNDAMILTISRQAFVNAGPNATICEGSSYTLNGATQQFATSILWTSSGTGTFNDATILNPVYTPSTADITAGTVTLTITGQSAAPCGPISDAMVLTISHQATAYAGADATICEGSTYTLSDAVATNAISILWTTNGTGVFNNPTTVNPTYIPSQSDILNGTVTLTMYANAASPCPGDNDAMVLTISNQAAVYAGSDATICEGNTFQLTQATQTNATSLLWTTSGTGTFSDPTILNPVYMPSVPDIANGSVTLTLTAQSASPCSPTSDLMVLGISRQAIANAGPDATICGGVNYSLTGASALNYVSVYWTTTGTGTFNSPYLVNPVYTPSQNDILDGSVILTMTAYSNAPCGNASDAMVLSFSAPVIIFAGADATICEGGSYTLSDASQTNTTSVLWSSSGTGTFNDPTLLNPVYTPSIADVTSGSVILTVTGQAAPPCSAVSDDMVLIIAMQAIAFAGDDFTICSESNYTISDAVATNATSILWTTTGTGVFNNPTIANPTYTPSQSDILNGFVTLSMSVQSATPCGSDVDEMSLFISRQAIISAGSDHTICEEATYTLSEATQQFATSLLWISSGTGTFSDATILNPAYTPGAEDVAAGSVTLILTATSASPCEPVSDQMVLIISSQASVNAGDDATICADSDYFISGATASNYTSITWTTSGSGSFDNPNLLNPVYTPGIIDITNGQVTLTIRVESATGCASVTDQMKLFIQSLPLAYAGPDLSVCQGESLQIISATASNYTSLYWTYTGQGSMLGINTLTPTYVPAANETGNIVLTLNVIGLEGCGGVMATDVMIVTIKPRVIADAGADQTIPYNTSTVLYGSASNGSGSYVYTWQPSSLLFNFNTTNPETMPLTNHTEFVLMVTDVVSGCQDLDSMMVFIDGINYPPVANDDYDTTKYNTSIRINILGNDYDPENSGLTVTFCGYPTNGLVVLNSDRTITYTPYEGFTGDDSLCYTICDKGIPVMCDDAMVYIHVLPKPNIDDIVIYNGISPNGDGINDTWIIKGIEDFPDNSVKIFNRWGDKITDLSRYDNQNVFWDATNTQGERVPDGTYYYILEIKDLKTYTGWIYIRSEN